jgi:6-phosphogluconolactonase
VSDVPHELRVLPDKDAVAAAAAEILTAAAAAGGQIALSGGSTPKAAYRLAAEQLGNWTPATLWLGDERYVPLDDERSNARMAREELVERLPEDGRPAFELVRTDLPPEEAASDYEVRLRGALRDGAGLDLALMGLGPDAHTASLFPGKPAVEEAERWVVPVPEAGMEPYVPRITMTLPVFGLARDVVFLVAGDDKAEAMVRAFGDPPDPSAPSAHVRPRAGRLLILADRAAAARLGAAGGAPGSD